MLISPEIAGGQILSHLRFGSESMNERVLLNLQSNLVIRNELMIAREIDIYKRCIGIDN